MPARRLWLGDAAWSGRHLTITYGVDAHRFSTSLWWDGVDLDALAGQVGTDVVRRLAFHIAAFEANKAASLRPDELDLGPFADLGTERFRAVWSEVFRKVWGQWRYENDLPDYHGPTILGTAAAAGAPPARGPSERRHLLFCGGGKDSLLAGRVLDEAGLAYSSYAYSHSTYGHPALQHELLDGVLDHLAPAERLRHWVFDDFIDSPVVRLEPGLGVTTLAAAETPSSLFGALPLALARGYTDLVVAHERSADVGNLVWDRTGERINHQWGKSLEAEQLLRAYVDDELIAGLSYSSVLKPVHDVLIFRALGESLDAVPATHSCNVAKPWCLRCAKCAYVWINYQAYLPEDVNRVTFGDRNLLDDPVNQAWFEQMLGLAAHTPFECIGQVDEARLAFELLRRRGFEGAAMRMFEERVGPIDAEEHYERLVAVARAHHTMPTALATQVVPVLERLGTLPFPSG